MNDVVVGHAAVGYLLYADYQRVLAKPMDRFSDPTMLTEIQTLALGLGTQLPDLANKTFACRFHIFPNGQIVGQSLVIFSLFAALLWVVIRRSRRGIPTTAFSTSYVSRSITTVCIRS